MTYFLGRDVEVYLTTESATAPSGGNACSIVVDTVSGAKLLRSDDGGSEDPVSGSMIPQMAFAAAVSGSVLDLRILNRQLSKDTERPSISSNCTKLSLNKFFITVKHLETSDTTKLISPLDKKSVLRPEINSSKESFFTDRSCQTMSQGTIPLSQYAKSRK